MWLRSFRISKSYIDHRMSSFHFELNFDFHFAGEINTKICTMLDTACYIDAEDTFGKNAVIDECDCLADCSSIG